MLGARAVRLYPIYHPAAALYTPRMLETLREDFARLPELLALGAARAAAAAGSRAGRRPRPPAARRRRAEPRGAPAGCDGACAPAGQAAESPPRPTSSACSRRRGRLSSRATGIFPAKEGIFGRCRKYVARP